MALNIKNPEAEQLASEVAALTGETKTEAIRVALFERKQRLRLRRGQESKQVRVDRLLSERIWPQIPRNMLGRKVSKREKERILGYGPDGV
jgi:antitoxin VapB